MSALIFAAIFAMQSVAVQVMGSAEVKDGNVAAARKAAIDDGIKQAVEQALEAVLDAPTRKAAAKAIRSRVLKRPHAFVPIYRVLDEKTANGHLELLLEAQVSTRSILRDLGDVLPDSTSAPPDTRPPFDVDGPGREEIIQALTKQGLEVIRKGSKRTEDTLLVKTDVDAKTLGSVRGSEVRVGESRLRARVSRESEPEGTLTEVVIAAVGFGATEGDAMRDAHARAIKQVAPALAARISARFPKTAGRAGQIVAEGPWEWADFVAIRSAAGAVARADAVPLLFEEGRFVLAMPPASTAKAIAASLTRGTYPPGHIISATAPKSGEVRVKIERVAVPEGEPSGAEPKP